MERKVNGDVREEIPVDPILTIFIYLFINIKMKLGKLRKTIIIIR